MGDDFAPPPRSAVSLPAGNGRATELTFASEEVKAHSVETLTAELEAQRTRNLRQRVMIEDLERERDEAKNANETLRETVERLTAQLRDKDAELAQARRETPAFDPDPRRELMMARSRITIERRVAADAIDRISNLLTRVISDVSAACSFGSRRRRDPLASLSAEMRAALAEADGAPLSLDGGVYRYRPGAHGHAPQTVYALADRGLMRLSAGREGQLQR